MIAMKFDRIGMQISLFIRYSKLVIVGFDDLSDKAKLEQATILIIENSFYCYLTYTYSPSKNVYCIF